MKLTWEATQKALARWACDRAQLDNDRAIWTMQAGKWPSLPWLALGFTETKSYGIDQRRIVQNPLVIPDIALGAVSAISNTGAAPLHGLSNADGPVQLVTTGTLPSPLALATNYWLVVVDANTLAFATSRAAALASTRIDLTDAGVGTHTVQDTPDTRRVGEEILHVRTGPRHGVLHVTCFSDQSIYDASPQGILERIRSRALLPKSQADLRAIGFALATFGAVSQTGGLVSADIFEARAMLDIGFNYVDSASEAGTYIERVNITEEVKDAAGNVVVSESFQLTVG